MDQPIWLAAGLRTPFTKVDGGLAKRDAIGLGVPVLKAMAERLRRRVESIAQPGGA